MAYSREIEKLERQFAENPRRFAAPFADALRKSADVARALEVIQVGLELNPDYIPGSVILGRCHLDLGDDHGAEAAFSRVLDLDNENVIALKSLADIMERQGRHDEAVSFLTYLLDVDRSNDEAREQLARIETRGTGAGAPAPASPESAAPPEPPLFTAAASGVHVPETPSKDASTDDGASPPKADLEEFLEPTALWEPPVNPAEASLSPWVETTTADSIATDEPVESILPEQETGDVAPLDGLEDVSMRGVEDITAGDFILEREEEIVLTGSIGTDYQVRNDAEDLLERALEPEAIEEAASASESAVVADPVADADHEVALDVPVAEPAAGFEVVDEEETATADATEDREQDAWDRVEQGADVEAPADDLGPGAIEEDEAPFEWAMHVAEEREFVPTHTHGGPHAPDSFDDAIEGIAPVDEDTEESGDEEGALPADEAPVLVVTESMAELYAAQGHPGEALGVYRILYDRNPDNERLRLRIQDLEAVLATAAGASATPSYAASVTGGTAVSSFLGSMLGARPAHVDLPEPPPVPEPAPIDEEAEDTSEEAVASGAPTRPAIDRLSLGAVFGEDPSPVPPAENASAPDRGDAAPGFSFDDFFGGGHAAPSGRTSAASVRASRAADDEGDLDQFHVWLQSLKR